MFEVGLDVLQRQTDLLGCESVLNLQDQVLVQQLVEVIDGGNVGGEPRFDLIEHPPEYVRGIRPQQTMFLELFLRFLFEMVQDCRIVVVRQVLWFLNIKFLVL